MKKLLTKLCLVFIFAIRQTLKKCKGGIGMIERKSLV